MSELRSESQVDEKYEIAEDRDLAATIILNGKKIRFVPDLVVQHNYNFDFSDIVRRKKFHARCTERYLRKYKGITDKIQPYNWKEWLKYLTNAINPPHPFNADLTGRLYSFVSVLTYTGASMSEIIYPHQVV